MPGKTLNHPEISNEMGRKTRGAEASLQWGARGAEIAHNQTAESHDRSSHSESPLSLSTKNKKIWQNQ